MPLEFLFLDIGGCNLFTNYHSGDQIKKTEVDRACSKYRERRGAYRVSVGKSEGSRSLERPRHRWEDDIKISLRELGWGSMDWIDLGQDRDRWRAVVNAVMNLRVPQNAGNLLSS
jgi:hypothetical protein